MRVEDRIDAGLEAVEHVLAAAPVTLESIDAKIDAHIARAEMFFDRVEAMLDAFEDFAKSPAAKMMGLGKAKGKVAPGDGK